jgi:GDP-L-fucose synthase
MHQAKMLGLPELAVWGDGTAKRELLYADDLAVALLFLMHAYDGREPVNTGSGDEWTIRAIADEVRRVVGYQGALFFDDSKPTGVPRKVLDNSFIRGLGWRPKVGFPEGLERTYKGFLQRMTLGS